MVRLEEVKIHTYWFRNDIWIDIVEREDTYEAWYYNRDEGIKEMMFGIRKKDADYKELLNMAERYAEDFK